MLIYTPLAFQENNVFHLPPSHAKAVKLIHRDIVKDASLQVYKMR